MYEALEGTLLAAIVAGGVYALTRQPDPELLTPEPTALSLRWPDRFRPGHRRAPGEAADIEADGFIEALHEPRPQPGGRHRRPGPPSLRLSQNDLPSSHETLPVTQAPGHPPWDTVRLRPDHPDPSWQTFTALEPPPDQPRDEPRPPRVYTGPDQQDPPTGVMDVRQILAGELRPYLDELPKYPED